MRAGTSAPARITWPALGSQQVPVKYFYADNTEGSAARCTTRLGSRSKIYHAALSGNALLFGKGSPQPIGASRSIATSSVWLESPVLA